MPTEIIKNTTNQEIKQFLLTNESYQLIINCQQRIYKETEVSPSIRKMINALINKTSIESLEQQLIEQLK